MAKHFIDRLRADLATLYNGSDTFVLALLDGAQAAYAFTAATSNSTFTATGHNFVNGVRVQVATSGGALPTGLVAGTTYYCINVATNTFQLAATKGGSAIAITDAGSGTNTVTEQPLSAADDDLAILVRHEVNYYGAARVSYSAPAAIADYTNLQASLPATTVTFTPTAGSITFRYSLLIRNGTATAGDTSGAPDQFQDYGTTQTIAQGTTKGIQVTVIRKDVS